VFSRAPVEVNRSCDRTPAAVTALGYLGWGLGPGMFSSTWCWLLVPAVQGGSDQVLSPQRPGTISGAQKTPPMTDVGERSSVVVYPWMELWAARLLEESSSLS
jgi:hypothetical protein